MSLRIVVVERARRLCRTNGHGHGHGHGRGDGHGHGLGHEHGDGRGHGHGHGRGDGHGHGHEHGDGHGRGHGPREAVRPSRSGRPRLPRHGRCGERLPPGCAARPWVAAAGPASGHEGLFLPRVVSGTTPFPPQIPRRVPGTTPLSLKIPRMGSGTTPLPLKITRMASDKLPPPIPDGANALGQADRQSAFQGTRLSHLTDLGAGARRPASTLPAGPLGARIPLRKVPRLVHGTARGRSRAPSSAPSP